MKNVTMFVFLMGTLLWTNGASAAGPELQPVGSITLDLLFGGVTDSQKSFATLSGSISLESGQGTVQSCIDDGYFQANGSLNFDIRCSVLMDDGSWLILNYSGVGVIDWQLFGKGEVIRQGNGAEYWISEVQMLTTSENYSWVNSHVFIGHGKELSAPSADGLGLVVYDLYKVTY